MVADSSYLIAVLLGDTFIPLIWQPKEDLLSFSFPSIFITCECGSSLALYELGFYPALGLGLNA